MRFARSRVFAILVVGLTSTIVESSAFADCPENTSCAYDGWLPFWPSLPPTDTPPKSNHLTSPGGETGTYAEATTERFIDLSNADCGGDDAGVDIGSVSVLEENASWLLEPTACDGTEAETTLQQAPEGTVPVASGQGIVPTVHSDGTGSKGDGKTTDPVDPITGEFVLEETDLAFPSFGVPFALRRTYRSRIDYSGPLGPSWDHTYNQRLLNAPRVAIGSTDPLPVASVEIGDGSIPVPVVSVTTCGPSVLLSTGEGTTIRFNEIATNAGTHSYWSSAALLTLTGTDGPSGPTWTLQSPGGDVRHFDAVGRLVQWVDANGIGLSLVWSGTAETARLDSVTDSAGRLVTFEYDSTGHLERVAAAGTQLEATYSYLANGALDTAHRADGHSERYEYDVDPARERFDWIPEQQLRPACEAACAQTDLATCNTGGACDEPVGDAYDRCFDWINDGTCAGTCHNECFHLCTEGAESGGTTLPCDAACEDDPAVYTELVAECVRVWNEEGGSAMCEACDDACHDGAIDKCNELVLTGDYTGPFTDCAAHLSICCADGNSLMCGPDSCNIGETCEDTCEEAFFGTGVVDTACQRFCGSEPNGDPILCDWPNDGSRFGCVLDATRACKTECGDDCAGVQCEPECAAQCTRSSCVTLGFEASCLDSCTDSCIAAGRDQGPLGEPRFGHPRDLNFNIVRIFDGADRLYLENTYGVDRNSPDFDAVIAQRFGDYQPQLARWDLVVGGGPQLREPPAWAVPLIEPAAEFEPVDICPFTCGDRPFDPASWDELVVPASNMYLVFSPGAVRTPLTGFAVNKTLTQNVGPTLMTFSRNAQGVVVGKVSRRTSTTNYFATTATSLPITLDDGSNATLATSQSGAVTITGTAAAKDRLLLIGSLTLFTDAAKHVQAYAGAPNEVLKATTGSCTAPFTFQRISDVEIKLSPATACSGELWLTPMAGRYPVQSAADQFPSQGLAALATTALHPVTLSPTRAGYIWREGIDGRRVREAAPSGAGVTDASTAGLAQYTATPMFSAPTTTSGLGEPLFVFHHVPADYRVTSPPPAPSDAPWQGLDLPMPSFPLSCDSTVPGAAIRGTGTRPTQATAIIDFHNARWTIYADEHNNVLRKINHDTGAVWSFNYDPIGQLIAVEHPDRARTCLVHDYRGNVRRRIDMPATVPGLPAPDAIQQDFSFHEANSAITEIDDPRTPGAWLEKINRDAAGNPLSVQEAGGITTQTFGFVGGTGADRFQIASATGPGNAVTGVAYDNGTLASVTVDPSGANLREDLVTDETGRVQIRTGALGLDQTWSYDGDGPFLGFEEWSGDGHSARRTFEYDDEGQVSAILVGTPGSERIRTELVYDITGSLARVKQIALDGSATTTVACQDVAPGGRVHETVSPEGTRTRYGHDGEGHVTSIIVGDFGPSPRPWDDGCLDHPSGGTQQFTLAAFSYDLNGRLVTATDERGLLTTITRDGLGRPIMVTRPDGTQSRRGFDALGNVTWEALYSTANAPSYRPPSWSDGGLQAASQMLYDERARLKEVLRWHFDGAQVAVGDGYATTKFAYDDVAHTITRTDDANYDWVTRFDAAGRIIEERAPDGTTRSYAYPDNRTVRISEPSPTGTVTRELALTAWGAIASDGSRVDTTTYPLASTTFDELLRPVTTTTLTGGSTTVGYDAFGRVISQAQSVPGGSSETITMVYDRAGQPLRRVSSADGATAGTWNWSYDVLGREIDAQDPMGRHTATSYVGGSSLPLSVTDPRGVNFQYTWATNVNQVFLNAVDPNGPDVSLTYVWDGRGNLVSASRTDQGQPAVSNTFQFDSLGDRTTETDNQLPTAWARTTQFDGRGLPTKTTVNSTYWTRTYDTLGRLNDIKVGTESTALARYTYSGFDYRLTRTLKSTAETRYTYDILGRLASQIDVKGATTLAAWNWQAPLDAVPRRASFQRAATGTDNSVFTADASLRLLAEDNASTATFTLSPTATSASANTTASATLGAQTWRYTLDGRSAWSRRVKGTTSTDYLRDAQDALTQIGTQPVSLDLSGAITNGDQLQVVYDALGQVSQLSSAGKTRTYRRDAHGRAVSQTNESGQITRFAWDGATRIVRQRSDGTTFDITVDGADFDEHVAVLTGSARNYIHQDRRGSVYLVTTDTGAVAELVSYTAYGEPTIRKPNGATVTDTQIAGQYGFNGLPHDFALGVVDMRARLYRPTLGRFLSPDPAGLIDGSNRFAFVRAMPLGLRDPFGLDSTPETNRNDSLRTMSDFVNDGGRLDLRAWEDYQAQAHIQNDTNPFGLQRQPPYRSTSQRAWDGMAGAGRWVGRRAVGLGEVVGGAILFKVGWAMCTTGIGCTLGRGAMLMGADLAAGGVRHVVGVDGQTVAAQYTGDIGVKIENAAAGGAGLVTMMPGLAIESIGAEAGAIDTTVDGVTVSGLDDLAQFRAELGLPTGEGTLTRLDVGGRSFYGVNAHGQPITLRVNAITRTHAEADAFQQAANAGISGGRGILYVDRALCPACGPNGGVRGMMRQLGLEELEVITPQGSQVIYP
jgi:RHS repeat-associated protein